MRYFVGTNDGFNAGIFIETPAGEGLSAPESAHARFSLGSDASTSDSAQPKVNA